MKRKFKIGRRAYSLIELSIVLVIISVLVAGAMTVSVEKLKTDQVRITKERMEVIYNRMGHIMRVANRLSCPSSLTKVKSFDAGYGNASCANGDGIFLSGNYYIGAVPLGEIALPNEYAEDGFGNKFIYFVDSRFTTAASFSSPPDFTQTNFSISAYNQLSSSPPTSFAIKENLAGTSQTVTNYAIVGLISPGANKFGAYNANASTKNSTDGASTDEVTNTTTSTSTFVASSTSSDTFDDIVFYKTMKDILKDFSDVKHIIPCDNTDANYVQGAITGDAWYGSTVYSKKGVCSSPNENLRFTKTCSDLGKFSIGTNSCAAVASGSCNLTNGQTVGGGSLYTGATQSYSHGSTISLSCNSGGGFGRKIIGGSRTSDNASQTCDSSPTDRTTTSSDFPYAVCINSTLYVINDCVSCRGCNNNSTFVDPVVSTNKDRSCNDNYNATVMQIMNECKNPAPGSWGYWYSPYGWSNGDDSGGNNFVSFSDSHGSYRTVNHRHRRRCNCDSDDRTVCVYVKSICRDGSYHYDTWWGADGDLDYACNSSPSIECAVTSEPRGNC